MSESLENAADNWPSSSLNHKCKCNNNIIIIIIINITIIIIVVVSSKEILWI